MVALVVIVMLAIAGCGTESTAAEQDPPVDLNALDVGGYQHEPMDFAPKSRPFVSRVFEAERLGAYVPLASEIDPGLKVNRADSVHAFLGPDEAHPSPMYAWLKKDGFGDDAKGFIAGFATKGESSDDYTISYSVATSVLLFDSDRSASTAATALAARGWSSVSGDIQVEPVRSAAHPEAISSWRPDAQVLASWYATGRFVIVALAESMDNRTLKISDRSQLQSLTDRAITVTSERIKTFQPTAPDRIGDSPLDPDGLLRISLRRPDGDSFTNMPGVYSSAAFLHLDDHPATTKPQFDRYGVDRIAVDAMRLYRTRDAQAAKQFVAEIAIEKFTRRTGSPTGLPTAQCREYHGPEHLTYPFYCYVAFGRYVAMNWGSQLSEVHQRISAQYSILARSK
ncbi:hypothetical protein ACFVUS_16670 [Nocardia sp. NPDC058058]|uniref:DUF7373 family lipoprotein n=1 Tax=Nocardia sp. NPDC058058 TaxID=3346317 RepID=UPI0036DCFBDB